MATNDFWNRLAGVRDADPRISAFSFWCAVNDLVLPGSGGLTQASAAGLWSLTGDALTEFNDLAASFVTITNANADLRLQRRLSVGMGIFAAVALGEQSDLKGNPYNDPPASEQLGEGTRSGERLRLRAKALVSAFGGTPQGTLAV